MNTVTVVLCLLSSVAMGCERILDELAPPDPDQPPSASPVIGPAPVEPVPSAIGNEPAPGTAAAAPLGPSGPALLRGAYELTWLRDSDSSPAQPMPATLLAQMPGCFWGRWTWVFGEDGTMNMANEILCEGGQFATGYGVCRAEAETKVVWSATGYRLPMAITARSRVVHYPVVRTLEDFEHTTVRCHLTHPAAVVTLTGIVASTDPTRPVEVTMALDDGSSHHLRAIASEETDHVAQIMAHRQ